MSRDAGDRSLYQDIARNALAATGARVVALVERDRVTGERRLLGLAGPAETLRSGFEAIRRVMPGFDPISMPLQPPLNPVLDAVYRQGEARLASFREATAGSFEPRLVDIADRFVGLRFSYLCPLMLGNAVLGVLSFHSPEPPDERERRVCEAFAAQAALTLENSHLTAQARAQEAVRADHAEEVARVLAAVGAAPHVEGALEALIVGAARLVPSTYGITRTFDPDTGRRDHEVSFEPDGKLTHKFAPGPLPSQSFGERLRKGSGPIVVCDYDANDPAVPENYAYAAGVRQDGIRAAVHMPIESGGRVIGNISLNHPEPGRFGPREVSVLGALTSLAGAAIDRARLDAKQRRADAEHAEAQARLAAAERERSHLLQTVIDSIPDSIYLKDLEGRFVLVNAAGARAIGAPVEALVGQLAADVVPAEEARACAERDRRMLQSDRPQTFERSYILDGQKMHGLTTKLPYRDVSGAVTGVLGVTRDITERVRAETVQREGRERYERQYRDLPLPAFTWQRRGEDFVLLDGNTAADRLTSGTLHRVLGSTVVEMFGAEPHFAAGFDRALTERSSHTREGVHRFLSTGETRHIRMTYVFQEPDLVVVYPVDLTDQDAREAAEHQKSKLDGALLVARTTAHQINNALAPVMGYAELMGLRPAVQADPVLASYATLIGTAAQDAAAKVRRLQSIVRLEETPSHVGSTLPVLDMDASTAVAR